METVELNDDFWQRNFAISVYKMFATVQESCRQITWEDDRKTAVEIEARLGDTAARLQTNRFSPGCDPAFFKQVKDHFRKGAPPTSETYDVTFKYSKIRVSVQVVNGEPQVVEAMRKMKDTLPNADAMLKGKRSFDLRVSLMIERQIPQEECQKECEAAKRWVRALISPQQAMPNPTSRLDDIASGCVCRISPAVGNSIRIQQASKEFEQERGWMQPQLNWTLVCPRRLKDLRNRTLSINESTPIFEYTDVLIGNLPGVMLQKSGPPIPVSAFEFQIFIKVKDLAQAVTASTLTSIEDDEVFVRHKKRWKHQFPDRAQVLDFTQTRQGETPIELQTSPVKNEMEMERCFSITEGKAMDATQETVAFLKAVSSVLFSTSLKLPSDSDSARWKSVAIPTLQLERFETTKKKTINNAQSGDRTGRSTMITTEDDEGDGQRKRQRMSSTENPSAAATSSLTSVDEAEDFYNQLSRNREDRSKSLIFHMRCFNNFVKSSLLNKYIGKILGAARILELACGKGADFGKMQKSTKSFGKYVGTDIAKNSLEEAVKRLGNSANTLNLKFVSADLSKCDISLSNWGSDEPLDVWERGKWSNTSLVLPESERFNFVSMQFALHYMFSSMETVDRFFRGVAARMDPGAFFVATTVSANALISALLNSPDKLEVSFRDEKNRLTCLIQFEEDAYERLVHPQKNSENEDWVGLQYRFKLFDGDSAQDRAVDAPEWLVTTPTIQRLAQRHGLKIVEQARLGEFALNELNAKGEEAIKLWKRMSVSNRKGTISDIEWTISNLYQVLVFQKTEESNGQSTEVPTPEANPFIAVMARLRNTPGWDQLTDNQKTEMVTRELAKG